MRFKHILQHFPIYRYYFPYTGTSAFTAVDKDITGTSNIRFPKVLFNDGGDYNLVTGVFTTRIAGIYWFSATIAKALNTNIDWVPCYLKVNSVSQIYLYTDPMSENELDGYSFTGSAAFRLQAGDRVQVGGCTNPGYIRNDYATHFSGFLIRPDV